MFDSKNPKDIDSKPKDFLQRYFFFPSTGDKALSFCLLPLSLIYYLGALLSRAFSKKENLGIRLISIGNLVSGGSGKTPFCIALANRLHDRGYKNIGIVLRGYGRQSRGLIQVSRRGEILCGVESSGDEAMLIAMQTRDLKTSVFVSEKREAAILLAKEQGLDLVLLDDAYRFRFAKFDILLEPKISPFYNRVLPSGYYRFPKSYYKKCDLHLVEGRDYERHTRLKDFCGNFRINHQKDLGGVLDSKRRYVLATAIANPLRLEPFLEALNHLIVHRHYLPDHASFSEKSLASLLEKVGGNCLLMTQKDLVKCQDFSIPICVMELELSLAPSVISPIISYLERGLESN